MTKIVYPICDYCGKQFTRKTWPQRVVVMMPRDGRGVIRERTLCSWRCTRLLAATKESE